MNGLLGDLASMGMGAMHGIGGLLGVNPQSQAPTQTEPQPQDIDLFGASAALPYGGNVQPVAAPQAPQAPQEGFLSKAGHFLFGGGQGDPNDPLGRFRPGLLQEALGTAMLGGNPWAARDMLTRRNIAQAMLPYQMQAQALQAANQRAIGEAIYRRLHPSRDNLQQAGGTPQGGASVQPVAMSGGQGGNGQQPAAGLDQETLGYAALAGYPNADKAWQVMAPDVEITRDGVIYNKKDPTGRIMGMAPHPMYLNGQRVDPNSPNAPSFVPQYKEGTMPDGRGGVIPIPGYASAAAQLAGAVKGAEVGVTDPTETVVIQTPQGPQTVTKAQLRERQGLPEPASGSQPGPVPTAAPGLPSGGPSARSPAASTPQDGSRTITPQQAMQFYVAKGYKPEQAAGIVGNLIGESGLDASKTSDEGGFGLAQWEGPRLQGLFKFAKANNLDPSDPNTQLEYSHYELTNGEKSAGDAIRNAGNVDAATAAAVGYERPAGYTPQNPQGSMGYGKRLGAARGLVSSPGGAPAQPASPQQPFISQGTTEATQKADQEEMTRLRAEVAQRQHMATRANEFIQKMGDTATGPGYGGFTLPFAKEETAPIADIAEMIPGIGGKLQDLNAITNSTWADQRQAGQGPIKGYEKGDWKQAFPNIANWGPTNVSIAKRLDDEARQSEAELAFKEGWLQKYGSLAANGGADAAWSKMAVSHNAQPTQPSRGAGLPARAPAVPQSAQPPAEAIKLLRQNPTAQNRQYFDSHWPGWSKRILGS